MAMAGVFAMGINVAEGSKEGREQGDSTKAPLSVLPIEGEGILEGDDLENALAIVQLCRKQILDGLKSENTEIVRSVPASFFRQACKFRLLEKGTLSFKYENRYTTLDKEYYLISECCQCFLNAPNLACDFAFPKNYQELMNLGIISNNPATLLIALEEGANCKGFIRCSSGPVLSLCVAIEKSQGNPDCVQLLLDFGADPNKMDNGRRIPLTMAICKQYHEITKILLDKGADPNKEVQGKWSPLVFAIQINDLEIVKLLLAHEICIDKVDDRGLPIIFRPIENNNKDIIGALLGKGISVNVRGKGQTTPLHWAVLHEKKEIIDFLLDRGANIFACDSGGDNCVDLAKKKGNEELAKYLEERREALADEIISVFKDPSKKEQQDLEIERLKQAHPLERENMLKLLMQRGAEITWFPSVFLTSHIINVWFLSSEDTCLFFEELMDGRFSETYKALPEGHKEKIMAFIDELKRSSEKKDPLKKESECKRPMIIPQNPQEGRVFGYKPREDKKDDAPDATTPKEIATGGVEEGESAKSIFNTPYEIIFRWNPDSRNTKIEGKIFKDMVDEIQELCAFLTKAGFKCDLVRRNNHYVLELGTFPEWAEALRRYNLPNRLSVDHGDNDTYSIFFDSTFSYLVHALCLLAQSEGPLSEQALDKLKKYAEEERLLYPILEIYTELEPYFKPYFF